jgi:predicted membrane protein
MATRNFRVSFQLIIGFIIISLGVLYLLQNFGVLYARDYTRLWPLLLVLYGVSRLVECDNLPHKIWGGFWVLVGSLWVLDNLDILYFDIWDLWPLVLVAIGLSLIWRPTRRRMAGVGGTVIEDSDSQINAVAMLGGFKRSNDSQDFRGGEITAIMGGCEIDLRRASIKESEAVLEIVAIMGGVEIQVPDDWQVTLQGVPILGGYEDKTHQQQGEARKRLIVKGYVIMGGVEIKN